MNYVPIVTRDTLVAAGLCLDGIQAWMDDAGCGDHTALPAGEVLALVEEDGYSPQVSQAIGADGYGYGDGYGDGNGYGDGDGYGDGYGDGNGYGDGYGYGYGYGDGYGY